MEYSEFAKKAVLYDTRNSFAKFYGNLDCVPDVLKAFYKESNPLDVEINCVRFFPVEKLASLQVEYAFLNVQFVFATCNGDPIFLHDGCVYTAPHGVKDPELELLANNIETYFESLLLE